MNSILPNQNLPSIVTQLLFNGAPNFNFAQVVSDLSAILVPIATQARGVTWDCDDIALLDSGALRIVLGISENIPGPLSSCLTVAVGEPLIGGATAASKSDQIALSDQIIGHLSTRCQIEDQRSYTLDQPLTPDLIDSLVDVLFQSEAANVVAAEEKVSLPGDSEPEPASASAPPGAEPGDMDRLMRRLTSELVVHPPNVITRAINSATQKPGEIENQVPIVPSTAAKQKSGMFWSRARASAPLSTGVEINGGPRPYRASSQELKVVRDALYAGEMPSSAVTKRLSSNALHAIKSLTDLSRTLAGAIPIKRRDGKATRKDPTKH